MAIRVGALAFAVVLTGSMTSCGGKQDGGSGSSGKLAIATGNNTGVYYAMGGGLAELIKKNIEGKSATAVETSASVDNIKGLVAGKFDIAFCLLDTASDAVNGKESFTEKQPIQALARIYPNYTQVAVRVDSGVNSLADLKGKAVSTGSPNSGTEVIARRLLETAGLDPAKDVKTQRLALQPSVDAMKDSKVDAVFWSGGLPTSSMTDLTTSLGDKVKFLDLSEALPKLQDKYGDVYMEGSIPAATYKLPGDVPTVVVPNVLLVKEGFDPDLAGKLAKLLFDKQKELAAASPAAKGIKLDVALKSDPVPLNEGAKKALEDLGAK